MIPTPAATLPRVLVIGASGQVGTQLCQLLGPRALAAGRSSAAPDHLASYDWLQVDLAMLAEDPAHASRALAHAGPLDAVICVAGATDVERCETEPAWAHAVNTAGPAALARATGASNLPFVYFSTEYVFDGGDSGQDTAGPYTEADRPHAISVYGESKLRGEELVRELRPEALVIRTTVVYGPDPARKNFLYFLRRELSAGRTIRVVDDQVSTPTSNDDLAAATLHLLTAGETGIYHVCGPDLLSRYEFAVRAARALSLDAALIQPVTTTTLRQKAPRPLRAGLKTDKLCGVVGPSLMKGTEAGVLTWAATSLPQK